MAGVKPEGLTVAAGLISRRAADGSESRPYRRDHAKLPGIKNPAGDGAGFSVTRTGAYWLVIRVT